MNVLNAMTESSANSGNSLLGTVQWPLDHGLVRVALATTSTSTSPSTSTSTSITCEAHTLVPVSKEDVGRRVLLILPRNADKPVICGFLWKGENAATKPAVQDVKDLTADGLSLILQCGDSKIELNHSGKIRLEGRELEITTVDETRITASMIKLN